MGGVVGAYVVLVMRVCALLCVESKFSEEEVNKGVIKPKNVNTHVLCFSMTELLGSYVNLRFTFLVYLFSLIKRILFD